MGVGLDSLMMKWMKVTMAIGAAKMAIDTFRVSNRQLQQEKATESVTLDAAFRNLNLQAGLSGYGDEEARNRLKALVFNVSEKRATPNVAYTAEAAKQLISIGFPQKEVEGGGLDLFVKFLQATTAQRPGVDPGQLARAMGSFITANEGEAGLTTKNLRRTSVAVQTLFQNTPLETSDLQDLAKVSGQVKAFGHLSMEEQLALYSGLRGRLAPAEASTGFRNVVQILTGAKRGRAATREGLARMNLKPEDVDAVGETFFEVLKRLKAGIESLPPEEVSPTLQQIFGRRAAGGALFGVESIISAIARLAAIGGAGPGFEQAAAYASQGEAAGFRRAGIRREASLDSPDAIRR